MERAVWLVSNGDYWKAVWETPAGRKSRSLGPKSRYSQRQARALCRRIEHEAEAGERRGQVPRLSEWLSSYERLRSDVCAATQRTYRDAAIYLRAGFDNDPPIDQITRADAAEWLTSMSSGELTEELNAAREGRKYVRLSLSTIRRHVRFAKMLFAEACRQDLLDINPFDRLVGSPPRIARDWQQVTHDDLRRVLDACPSDGWRCLFGLTRWAGLRLSEALDLRWGDVDFGGNRMTVNARCDEATTKRRRRVAPIEPARCPTGLTALLLDVHGRAEGDHVCQLGSNNHRRDGLGIIRRAGLPTYAKPFHTLRKCRETELAAEYPLHVVVEWCGNSPDVAQRHYLRVPEQLYETSVQVGHVQPTNGQPVAEQ